jgi:uncharacterized protein YndB with AHSA1/START domain
MDNQSVIHNTFVIERSYPQSAERVFAAFKDPAKKRRWFAEGEKHDVESFEMDFRVGGSEHYRFRFNDKSPFPGVALTNDSTHLDIVPDQRIVTVYSMSLGGKHISASLVTIELLPTQKGTDLICTHQGVFLEGSGGPEMREAGWRFLFDKLAAELAK